MSKQEMLVLSTKDRDRLKVLHEVKRKHLTQRAAARQPGDQRSLGQKAAGPGEEGRGRRDRASGAGASVEPALAGKPAHPNAEAGAGEVPRLWTHAGLRVPGEGPPSGGEQGDAATVADRGRAAAGEAAESGRGARVAAAAELSRGAGAVGHLGARLAGRAGAKAVLGGDDR